MSLPSRADDVLSPWERRGLFLFAALLLLLGFVTEYRWACMTRPKGDLGVYLRAAFAVRTGQDIYSITDHNGWHYHYPPLLAIALVPLASELGHEKLPGMLPSAVSVGLWYAFSVLFLALGVHVLANALEATGDSPPKRFGRRWWSLRVLPVVVCAAPVAHTLSRGQVNILLMMLLCGTAAAILRGQRWRAGLWLAGAICLKVIPAFLLLYPLWRRDGRCLAGCCLGLSVGLLLIPSAVFGPERTVAYYEEWADVLLVPAVTEGGDQARAKELTDTTATKSQSFVAVLHNTLHPFASERPAQASPAVRLAHWSIGAALTALTLCAVGWRRSSHGANELLFFGTLILLMLLLSPICHSHYLTSAVPLVMGLIFVDGQRREMTKPTRGMMGLLAFFAVANALPLFDDLSLLRDFGLATYASLLLGGVAVGILWRARRSSGQELAPPASWQSTLPRRYNEVA